MTTPKMFTMLGTSRIDVLVSAADSGGAVSILTESCEPGGGPPPHVHTREDEFLMPLEGTFEMFDGTNWGPMPAQGLFTPHGHLHTWRKSDGEPGKILVVVTPGGFEDFLYALRDTRLPEGLTTLIEVSLHYGISYPSSA